MTARVFAKCSSCLATPRFRPPPAICTPQQMSLRGLTSDFIRERSIAMPRKKSDVSQTKSGSVLEYLQNASPSMLQAFELSRLNHVSNMRKELRGLVDQMLSDMSEALLARTLLNHQKEIGERRKRPAFTVEDLLSELTVHPTEFLAAGKKAK